MQLVDLIQSHLTDEVVARLACALSEEAGGTRQALVGGAIPAVLSALVNRYSGETGGERLAELLRAGRHDGDLLINLAGAFSGGAHTDTLLNVGKGLLGALLGSRSDSVAELIANTTAIRRSSASSLLGLAVPLVLAVLGKLRVSQNLDAASLRDLLAGLKGTLDTTAMPGLASALGVTELAVAPLAAAASQRATWPWIIVPVAMLGFGYALKSCQQRLTDSPPPATRSAAIAAANTPLPSVASAAVPAAVPEPAPKPLPEPALVPAQAQTQAVDTATAQPAPATPPALPTTVAPTATAATAPLAQPAAGIASDSVAYDLAQFLADPASSAPRSFVLRNLNFDSGTAVITQESRNTLRDVASVLNAHQTARVMLQGHTDDHGDPTANYDLSQARANAVRRGLIALGVAPARLSTAGFGADRPLEGNDTAAGRALNRRTELVVTVK